MPNKKAKQKKINRKAKHEDIKKWKREQKKIRKAQRNGETLR